MVDAQALKIELWAEDGDREEPETVGIDRARGWTVEYEQLNSGSEPERTVFNQLMRELCGWALTRIREGVGVWDGRVDYEHPAFCATTAGLHVSLESSGPSYGNAADPTSDGQTVWRVY